MSYMPTSSTRRISDHFEPDPQLDPQTQRQLRAHLEQIDFAAFAANREVLGKTLGRVELSSFQRLAIASAQARARWVYASLTVTGHAEQDSPEDIAHLQSLRVAYEELTLAYEALRRLVERGYVTYQAAPKA